MSSNVISDAFEGGIKGLIKLSIEEVKDLVYKYRNKDLLFIGKKETIERLKKERNSEEWKLFDKYIKDKKLRILVQMGLTMRDLENDDPEEISRLQEVIVNTHGSRGIHIAHFVQTGFLSNYIGTVITENISEKALREGLEETLRAVDKYIVFIKNPDKIEETARILQQRIEVNLPKVLIMYSLKSATKNAKKIKGILEEKIEHYYIRDMNLSKERYICFFIRDDNYYKEDVAYFSP